MRLDATQWGISLLLGALSLPIAVVIRLIPNEWIENLQLPQWRKNEDMSGHVESRGQQSGRLVWNEAVENVRSELLLLKRWRISDRHNIGLRMPRMVRALLSFASHPRTVSDPEEEALLGDGFAQLHGTMQHNANGNHARPHIGSAITPVAIMAGMLAGSIASWKPLEPEEEDVR